VVRELARKFAFARKLRDLHWPTGKDECLATIPYAGDFVDSCRKLLPVIVEAGPNSLRMLEMHRDSFSTQFNSKFPKSPTWLEVLVQTTYRGYAARQPEIVFRFPEARAEQVLRFTTTLFAEGQADWLTPLKDMPDTNPQWMLSIASARFLHNPSKDSLAEQLRILARLREDDLLKTPPWYVPWPLSACIEWREGREALEYLARLAEEGALGDTADWATAEQRWISKGVTLEDVEHSSRLPYPLGPDIRNRGFPASSLRQMFLGNWMALTVDSILSIQKRLATTPLRGPFAYRLLWAIATQIEYYPTAKDGAGFKPLRALLHDIPPKIYFHLSVLNHLFPDGIDDQWIEVLDRIGTEAWLHGPRRASDTVCQELWKGFISKPGRRGILRLLAQLSTTTQLREIPFEYLDPSRFDDLKSRAAAIIVLLSQRTSRPQASDLGRLIATITEDPYRFISEAMEAVRNRSVDIDFANEFLLALLTNLPIADTRAIEMVIEGLDSSVRRRTSQLDDPAVWTSLKLPLLGTDRQKKD
jgi:hypothetical protein